MTSETALYNMNDKKKFLEDMIESGSITKETSKNYERILGLTANMEKALKKDLNKFSFEELETIMYSFKANNRNTVETYSRIISSYLNWSVEKGLTKYNALSVLKPNDFVKYLTNEEVYFTEKKLRRWENRMENYQDAVIVSLIFNGVGGKQMSELRNLKKTDIDIENKRIKLINSLNEDENGNPIRFTERWMSIDDDHVFELIYGAINQKTYVKRNGDINYNPHIRPYTDLANNDYVIRPSITKTENLSSPVDKFVIYRRIKVLSETLGIDNFTSKHIQRSGMIAFANKIIKDNKITLDDLKVIADKFGIKSYHNLKGIVTIENINKTYPK